MCSWSVATEAASTRSSLYTGITTSTATPARAGTRLRFAALGAARRRRAGTGAPAAVTGAPLERDSVAGIDMRHILKGVPKRFLRGA